MFALLNSPFFEYSIYSTPQRKRLGYPGGVLFFDVAPNFSVAGAGLEGSVMARNPRESVTRSTALRAAAA